MSLHERPLKWISIAPMNINRNVFHITTHKCDKEFQCSQYMQDMPHRIYTNCFILLCFVVIIHSYYSKYIWYIQLLLKSCEWLTPWSFRVVLEAWGNQFLEKCTLWNNQLEHIHPYVSPTWTGDGKCESQMDVYDFNISILNRSHTPYCQLHTDQWGLHKVSVTFDRVIW